MSYLIRNILVNLIRVLKIIIKNFIAALFSINRNKNCLM